MPASPPASTAWTNAWRESSGGWSCATPDIAGRPARSARVTRFATFEVRLRADKLRLDEFEADFGEPAGGEVLVDYEAAAPPSTSSASARSPTGA